MASKNILFILPLIISLGCSKQPVVSNTGHAIDTSTRDVTSWEALRKQNVIMQQHDYSCGAASLATLMKYYFDDDISEKVLLNYIKQLFSKQEYARIEKDGLSFLELEKISRAKGYQSASVRLKLAALRQLSGPVIVYIETKHYRHFAVLRGIKEDRVFLADPSRGNIRLPIEEFVDAWKGETFVLGKKGFGTPNKHPLAVLHNTGFRNELELLRQPLLQRPKISLLK
jgi:predicted double-glycine peptidase